MNIFIVHGYRGNIHKHWFPWLAHKLTEQGHDVTIIEFPDSDAPQKEKWVQTLYNIIGVPNKNTLIITH